MEQWNSSGRKSPSFFEPLDLTVFWISGISLRQKRKLGN